MIEKLRMCAVSRGGLPGPASDGPYGRGRTSASMPRSLHPGPARSSVHASENGIGGEAPHRLHRPHVLYRRTPVPHPRGGFLDRAPLRGAMADRVLAGRRVRDRGGARRARAVHCDARPDGRPEWPPRGFPYGWVPLATTVLLAVWALAILYLARGREAAEAAGRRNLRRSVVGAYVTLVLVAAWTAALLHPDRSQGAAARIWKLERDCEVYSLQYPNLQSRKCSPVDRRSGRFVLPNTASIQPRNSSNSSRSRAGSPGRRRA